MVAYSQIVSANSSLKAANLVAVFVGATQGIGLGTLRAFAKHTISPTAYIVGRSETGVTKIIDDLRQVNANGTYLPIKCTDLTLLRAVDEACSAIIKHPTNPPRRIDILCNSAGFVTFGARNETVEGLDSVMAIQFYSRMKFVENLLPLIRAAPAPRIVSVLAGGKEGSLWADDLELKKNYSILNVSGATGSMTTLYMDALASDTENKKISFIHTFPGFVGDTNIFNKSENISLVVRLLLNYLVSPLVNLFMGMTSEQCGERTLYATINPAFGKGQTVYLAMEDSSSGAGPKVLAQLREQDYASKLYRHTQDEFERVAKIGST